MREAVRSGRRANFFITENKFIDCYAAKVGGSGVAVYSILQRCANSETRETWVSAQKMAEVLAMDKSTVYRHLQRLEDLQLIKTLRTREKTIYVVLPVPAPRPEAGSTPLFDSIENELSGKDSTWSPVASQRTDCNTESELSQRDAPVASVQQHVALVQRASRTSEKRNKEEQDFLNKTQDQDFFNKIEIDTIKSARSLIKALKLSDASMAAAIAAIEEKRESKVYSSDGSDPNTPFSGTVNELATLAHQQGRRPNGVSNEEFLDQFLARPSAVQLLKTLGLPATPNMISIVAEAIKAQATYSKSNMEESAANITRAAMEDNARGITFDRFYFENAKWRSHGRTGKGEQQFERIKRARDAAHAIIDAQMDR